jgi:pimeloyl-ACP methyl ester carboxylesterase
MEQMGYHYTFIPTQWENTTIIDWQQQAERVYDRCQPDQTILAGFSFSGMTALAMAAKRPPAKLWLFSPSPYFAEDIPTLPANFIEFAGKYPPRLDAFRQTHFNELAPRIACPTLLVRGGDEGEQMAHRLNEAERLIPDTYTYIANGVTHNLLHPIYLATIKQALIDGR